MSTELSIYKINTQPKEQSDGITKQTITLVLTGSTYNSDTIEELQNVATRNYWHVESECGAEFELLGSDLNKYLDKITLFDKNFVDTDFYRCSISY